MTYLKCVQVEKLMKEDEDDIRKERRHSKRTIGIISLWNENVSKITQSKCIEDLLDQNEYVAQKRKDHEVRCSDARGFQGDEKDIILLSLVIGEGENRQASSERSMFNVAVSRARYAVRLFHSVKPKDLKETDLRRNLLDYFMNFKPDSDLSDVWSSVLDQDEAAHRVLTTEVTNKLRSEGYTVKPFIKKPGLVIEVGSDDSQKICLFVVLGQEGSKKWKHEQEICYMLSRLDPKRDKVAESNRSWKAIWLFDAIVRPDRCLKEMTDFLAKNGVKPKPGVELEGGASSKRPAVQVTLRSGIKSIQ